MHFKEFTWEFKKLLAPIWNIFADDQHLADSRLDRQEAGLNMDKTHKNSPKQVMFFFTV